MTPAEIITDLKSRGERNITFNQNGTVVSRHGNTINYWYVKSGELICYDCKTINAF